MIFQTQPKIYTLLPVSVREKTGGNCFCRFDVWHYIRFTSIIISRNIAKFRLNRYQIQQLYYNADATVCIRISQHTAFWLTKAAFVKCKILLMGSFKDEYLVHIQYRKGVEADDANYNIRL